MPASHLDLLRVDLHRKVREACRTALDNVIPPWCEGIDPAFWTTPFGRELGTMLWMVNRGEALTVQDVCRMVWHQDSMYYRGVVKRIMPIYYRRNTKYVLRSDLALYWSKLLTGR